MYSAACNRAAMLIFPRFGVILAASVRARSPFFCLALPRQHTCRARTHGPHARTAHVPHTHPWRTERGEGGRTHDARARTCADDGRTGERTRGGRGGEGEGEARGEDRREMRNRGVLGPPRRAAPLRPTPPRRFGYLRRRNCAHQRAQVTER